MKKAIVIIFVFLSLFVFSQERFFNLYPGWELLLADEDTNGYIMLGMDTIDGGYSNTPIMLTSDLNGNMTDEIRYYNDTVDGFSMYSRNSYSITGNQIVVSGVYKQYDKSYTIYPVLMYFNNEDFTIDSIRGFTNEFDSRSTIINHHVIEGQERILLLGSTQFSLNYDIPGFWGIYNPVSDIFSYKIYDAPSNCKMIPYQVLPTGDGGYLLACEQDMTYYHPEEVFACILKLDPEGNEQWRYVISDRMVDTEFGTMESATFRPRIFDSPDGNYWVVWTDPKYIMATNMQSNDNCQVWIAKLTDNGDSCTLTGERGLMHEFDDPDINWWIINDSYQSEDGTMYILLQNFWDYNSALAKIHPNGVGAWFRTYKCYPEDVGSSYTYLKGMTHTSDGGFMLTGGYLNHGTEMFPDGMIASVVFKVDSCGCFEEEGCNDHCMDSYSEHYVYMQEASICPNPAKDKITVGFEYEGGETEFSYKVYSLDGKVLAYGTTRQESHGNVDITTGAVGEAGNSSTENCNLNIDTCDLPSGYYMVQLWGGGKIFTGKFVKE